MNNVILFDNYKINYALKNKSKISVYAHNYYHKNKSKFREYYQKYKNKKTVQAESNNLKSSKTERILKRYKNKNEKILENAKAYREHLRLCGFEPSNLGTFI
jgi:hypothetical protein